MIAELYGIDRKAKKPTGYTRAGDGAVDDSFKFPQLIEPYREKIVRAVLNWWQIQQHAPGEKSDMVEDDEDRILYLIGRFGFGAQLAVAVLLLKGPFDSS